MDTENYKYAGKFSIAQSEKKFHRLSSEPPNGLWFEYPCNRTQLSSLASKTIGQTPEVTLYLYQLWHHIYTDDDVAEIAQSFVTQVCK